MSSDITSSEIAAGATGPGYNPFAPEQIADPYPFFARARAETPVFYSPLLHMWVVTRYDDILMILKDPRRFSSTASINTEQMDAEARALFSHGPQIPILIDSNPPVHTRLRSLVNAGFTPRRIALLEPRIRAIAADLVAGFQARGAADLTARFAYPLPMTVIAELFGIPHAEAPQVKEWSNQLMGLIGGNLPPEAQMAAIGSLRAFQKYFTALLEERRAHPADDLLTDLLQAREGDQPALTIPEIVAQLGLIIVAGHETTTHLIGSLLVLLLRHPDQMAAVRQNPALIPAAVEEALRVESPASGSFRSTTESVTIDGVTIPAGARLLLRLGAANHDPAQFAHPDHFDLDRAGQGRHLAFGWGIHFCLGAPLARLEGRIALETLLHHLPNLRFQPGRAVEYLPNLILRGVQHLYLEWDVPPQRTV